MRNKWKLIYRTTYSQTGGNDGILALAQYGGRLYLGAGRWQAEPCSANVFRRELASDSLQWQDFTPPWAPTTSGYSMVMCVFQDRLHVGTDQGEVWRTDGQIWEALPNPGLDKVLAMVEFQGSLYVATQEATIWRIASDGTWHPVVASGGVQPPRFGDPTNKDIASLEVFSGRLYAGVGKDGPNGIQLWRTSDGLNWELFHEILPAALVQTPGHVHAMRSQGSYLYVAPYHGRVVARTDGSLAPAAGHWSVGSEIDTTGDVFRFAEYQGALCVGRNCMWGPDASLGSPLLYSSGDGLQWSPVEGSPVVGSSTHAAWSLLSPGAGAERLYLGTRSFATSGSGEAALWQLSPEPETATGVIWRLAWAWEILFGSILLLTPGGVFCLTCGNPGPVGTILVNVVGIGSVLVGAIGLVNRLRKRR
jgi:hypothetical protein